MGDTKIQWTEKTWNPVRGCSRVSPGCQSCYAERMAARNLPGMKSPTTGEPFAIMKPDGPHWTGKVELIPHMLEIPLRTRKPTTWFVNSMSDLFHEDLPDADILHVFRVIKDCPHHTFQILTKRAKNMRRVMTEMYGKIVAHVGPWPLPNVWLGVSVEDQQRADERIPLLLQTPAAVRFISAEPLLGPVDLCSVSQAMDNCEPTREQIDGPLGIHYIRHGAPGLDWVIVGGESGPGARPMDLAWARSIVGQCKEAGVAVFCKQLGSRPHSIQDHISHRGNTAKKPDGFYRYLNDKKGGDMAEWPEDLRLREMPAVYSEARR